MKIDVVIPVYHPDEKLDRLIRMLTRQTLLPHKLIIMKTGERLEKEELFRGWLNSAGIEFQVHCLAKEEYDHGNTRHQGILKSDAPAVVCMTQDAVFADEKVIEMLVGALFSDTAKAGGGAEIAAAYARQLPAADCGFLERYTRSFNYPETSRIKTGEDIKTLGIKTYFCSNVCAAYKRDIYDKLGGFIRKTIFNEDMIYAACAIQAGYGIAYAADARVIHSHNYGLKEQFQRNFDLAVSQADHPEIFDGISSENEGMKLVKQTAAYAVRKGRPWLLWPLFWQSAAKYLGYRMGKNYKKLPRGLILACTMNRRYWE